MAAACTTCSPAGRTIVRTWTPRPRPTIIPAWAAIRAAAPAGRGGPAHGALGRDQRRARHHERAGVRAPELTGRSPGIRPEPGAGARARTLRPPSAGAGVAAGPAAGAGRDVARADQLAQRRQQRQIAVLGYAQRQFQPAEAGSVAAG